MNPFCWIHIYFFMWWGLHKLLGDNDENGHFLRWKWGKIGNLLMVVLHMLNENKNVLIFKLWSTINSCWRYSMRTLMMLPNHRLMYHSSQYLVESGVGTRVVCTFPNLCCTTKHHIQSGFEVSTIPIGLLVSIYYPRCHQTQYSYHSLLLGGTIVCLCDMDDQIDSCHRS